MADDLDRLEQLERTATAGPWERFNNIGEFGLLKIRAASHQDRTGRTIYRLIGEVRCEEDSVLIVALRNAAPALLQAARAAERYRAALKELRRQIEAEYVTVLDGKRVSLTGAWHALIAAALDGK